MAWVSLIDTNRQWIKSSVGGELKETSREIAFCAHAIEQQGLLIVPDARVDERFAANPLVTGAPHIRFYAGAPLITPGGHALGTVCVLDRTPRTLSEAQTEVLLALAEDAMAQLELSREQLEANSAHARLSLITDVVPVMVAYIDAAGRINFVNKAYEDSFGCSRDEVLGKDLREVLGKDRYRGIYPYIQRVLTGHRVRFEALARRGCGECAASAPPISPIGASGARLKVTWPY
jgi:PAS domain S-box-containing protein